VCPSHSQLPRLPAQGLQALVRARVLSMAALRRPLAAAVQARSPPALVSAVAVSASVVLHHRQRGRVADPESR